MANKRMLKKGISAVCGDIAGICMFSEVSNKAVSNDVAEIVIDLATAQEDSRRKVSISFDKSPRDFANLKEYRIAKNKYYKTAYTTLIDQLNAQLEEIIKRVNALPD